VVRRGRCGRRAGRGGGAGGRQRGRRVDDRWLGKWRQGQGRQGGQRRSGRRRWVGTASARGGRGWGSWRRRNKDCRRAGRGNGRWESRRRGGWCGRLLRGGGNRERARRCAQSTEGKSPRCRDRQNTGDTDNAQRPPSTLTLAEPRYISQIRRQSIRREAHARQEIVGDLLTHRTE